MITRAQVRAHLYRFLGFVFIMLFFSLALQWRDRSLSFNKCLTQQVNDNHYQYEKEHLPVFLVSYPFAIPCTGTFIDQNSTGITAVATAFIAIFTFTLWSSTKAQWAHDKEINRAYVSGGGPTDVANKRFQLTIDNYGKTPAYLQKFAIEFCDISSIPKFPRYSKEITNKGVIAPHTTAHPLKQIRIPNYARPVVYGRFWYKDIWGRRHSFGFIQEIATGHAPQMPFSDDYTKND